MPRTARLDAPGLVHHIIARGIDRRKLFLDDQDYNYFIKKLETILINTANPCYAWVLMPNHFHLVIRTGDLPLSKIMHRLLGGYAIYFNQRHKRSGHLFSNRYKSIVVEEDSYLATLISYIHLNPVRAGIQEEISGLDKYKWSGHIALIDKNKYKWQDTNFVIDFFGNKKSYLKYLVSQNKEKQIDLDGGGLRRSLQLEKGQRPKEEDSGSFDARILGSNEYASSLMERLEEELPKPSAYLLEQILNSVCNYYDIPEQILKGKSRVKKLSNARGVIASLAVRKGLSCATIARKLDLTGPAIIKAVARGDNILSTNPELKDKLGVS